jgi:hypothetical protein
MDITGELDQRADIAANVMIHFFSKFKHKKGSFPLPFFNALKNKNLLQFLFNACRFTCQITQVIQFGTADVAAALNCNLADNRAVSLKNTLYTCSVRNLSDGESRI